jgi:hypothetical protein
MSKCIIDLSSIIGLGIIIGFFVSATNLKAVQAVGLVRHMNIVSKATVNFLQLCVAIDDRVKR